MDMEITLTEEQAMALATAAKLHRQCGDSANAAACDSLVDAVTAGVPQTLDAQAEGGGWLMNVLNDMRIASLVTDDKRPAFSTCLRLAEQLDEMAIHVEPEGTA
jgi:hypothetical protein